jgi:hypothetical protein
MSAVQKVWSSCVYATILLQHGPTAEALEIERQCHAAVLPTNDRLEGLAAAFKEGRTALESSFVPGLQQATLNQIDFSLLTQLQFYNLGIDFSLQKNANGSEKDCAIGGSRNGLLTRFWGNGIQHATSNG